jgi:hypothetical protein
MAKVSITPKTDCWVWTAAKDQKGYGHFGVGRSTSRKAHRVSFEMFCEEIPQGSIVCHRCDNPSCVNPDHLFIGTQADNAQDRDAKGRQAFGERSGRAKLTASDIPKIRMSNLSERAIARQMGVSRPTISAVLRGETWRHV